jgi:hypothetical protein
MSKMIAAVVLVGLVAGCHEYAGFDITTATLEDGTVGVVYADTIRTEGGYGDVDIYVLSGQLPPGIAFRQAGDDAALYGTPQLAGDYLFTVEARAGADSGSYHGAYVTRGFLLTIRQ